MENSSLFIYNPTCDMAVENGTLSYMPPKNLLQFENDITPLMGFLGSERDLIVCPKQPDQHFTSLWGNALKTFPKPIDYSELNRYTPKLISQIVPWGWSYKIAHQVKNIISSENSPYHYPTAFDSNFKAFHSRKTSVDIAQKLHAKSDRFPDIIKQPFIPKSFKNLADIQNYLASNPEGIILKTLWSSSGRGICRILNESDFNQALPWIKARIKQHSFIIAEPLLKKYQDASLQFIITSEKEYQKLGLNYFDTDEGGHFQREYFHIPEKMKPYLPDNNEWINDISDLLIQSMRELKIHDYYQGPIGVDVLFYKDDNNLIKLMPCIEANLRCNMGLINLNIKKHVHPKSTGYWTITSFVPEQWEQHYQENSNRFPVRYKDKRILSGFIPLVPNSPHARFAAWGHVYEESV